MKATNRRAAAVIAALLLAGCAGTEPGKYAGQAPQGYSCHTGEECVYDNFARFTVERLPDGEVRIVGEMVEYRHSRGGVDGIVSGTLFIGCFNFADRQIQAVYRIGVPKRRVNSGIVAAAAFDRRFAAAPNFNHCQVVDYINAPR